MWSKYYFGLLCTNIVATMRNWLAYKRTNSFATKKKTDNFYHKRLLLNHNIEGRPRFFSQLA